MTADDLVGPWHLVEDKKDNATAMETIPGAMEFGSSMEITSDGHISWYIGADGGTGTYSLSGDILSADMTNDFDQSSMKMEFTAEKTDDGTFLYTEYKGLLLFWSQGEGETGKGGDDEAESGYPGADVVEQKQHRAPCGWYDNQKDQEVHWEERVNIGLKSFITHCLAIW